eukprot:scaffold45105_cov275-Amphora_coffeaeformis.AAC.3
MGNAIEYLGNAFLTGHRLIRIRVVTAMDGVRDRFGPVNEQVFTWVQVPISAMYAGIRLNGWAMVVADFFNVPPAMTLRVVGMVVLPPQQKATSHPHKPKCKKKCWTYD